MPAVAWVTMVIAIVDHRRRRARPGPRHLPPDGDPHDARDLVGGVRWSPTRPARCPRSCRRSTPASSPSATSANRSESESDHARPRGNQRLDHQLGDRLHDRASSSCWWSSPSSCRSCCSPSSIGNEAKEIDDSLTESVHNTAALARAATRRSTPPRRSPPGSAADATGWEADHESWLALTSTQKRPVVGRGHRRVRRRARRRRAAHDPRPAGAHHRPPGRRLIKDTLQQAAANTADTALIAETAAGVDAVLAEGLEHHLFLGRVLDKVRS